MPWAICLPLQAWSPPHLYLHPHVSVVPSPGHSRALSDALRSPHLDPSRISVWPSALDCLWLPSPSRFVRIFGAPFLLSSGYQNPHALLKILAESWRRGDSSDIPAMFEAQLLAWTNFTSSPDDQKHFPQLSMKREFSSFPSQEGLGPPGLPCGNGRIVVLSPLNLTHQGIWRCWGGFDILLPTDDQLLGGFGKDYRTRLSLAITEHKAWVTLVQG